MSSSFATTIDVREITPRDGHPMTFITFDVLAPDQSLQMVNDHNDDRPRALHYQFDDRCPGAFGWAYLVGAAPAASNSCCSGRAGCS